MPLVGAVTCTRLPSHRELFGECIRIHCGSVTLLFLIARVARGDCFLTTERFFDEGPHDVLCKGYQIPCNSWDEMQTLSETDPTMAQATMCAWFVLE